LDLANEYSGCPKWRNSNILNPFHDPRKFFNGLLLNPRRQCDGGRKAIRDMFMPHRPMRFSHRGDCAANSQYAVNGQLFVVVIAVQSLSCPEYFGIEE